MQLDRRLSPDTYRRVTVGVVVCMGFVIVTGALVRLTGSGLGCPKWPTCTAGDVVAPLSYHPLVEFVNRVVTLAVSIAIMAVAVASFARQPRRRDLTLLSAVLVVGLVAEIVLGGITVEHRLNPGFVMAHFLLAIGLLLDSVVLPDRASRPDPQRPDPPPHATPRPAPATDRRLTTLAWTIVGLVLTTIVAGTVVTGAGPHSGASAADGQVRRWHLSLHRVTQVHGSLAMLTLAVIVATWWLLRSHPSVEARHRLQQLVEAIAIQVAIGYTQYFTGVPALLVAFHIVGAVLVWTAALRFALFVSSLEVERPSGVAGTPTLSPTSA
jgi:cytochrome c oxidase assembly protein subunit 15